MLWFKHGVNERSVILHLVRTYFLSCWKQVCFRFWQELLTSGIYMTLFQSSAILQRDNKYIIQMVQRYRVESPATDSLKVCNEIFFSYTLILMHLLWTTSNQFCVLKIHFCSNILYGHWVNRQEGGLLTVCCVGFLASSVFPDFVSRITLTPVIDCTAVIDFFRELFMYMREHPSTVE